MADLKLKQIYLRNWMRFNEINLQLPERGLVMVTGQNTASGGCLESVGSGKTSVGEAISRALLGIEGRYQHLKLYSTDENGDTYVRIDCEFLGKPLVVEMGYKCEELSKTSEALRYHYDGKTIERGLVSQTRAELSRLLGVPSLLAQWAVFVDGDNLKFNKLSQAECVELVLSALRQPPWSEYHDRSKKAVGKFKQVVAKDEAAHSEAQRREREAEQDLKDAAEDVATEQKNYEKRKAENDSLINGTAEKVQEHQRVIEHYHAEQQKINKKLKEIEQQKSADYHKLEIQRNEIADRIQKLEAKREVLLEERDDRLEKHVAAKHQYEHYEKSGKEKVCPTCKQPISSKIDPEKLQKLKKAWEDSESNLQKTRTVYEQNEQKIKEQARTHAQVVGQIEELSVEKEVKALSESYEDYEDRVRDTLNEIHRLELRVQQLKNGVSDEKLKAAQATRTERERVASLCKKNILTCAKSLTESQASMRVLEYWNAAFSPYGIPNMVLKDAIQPLNMEARRVSMMMTGGTIEIVYSTRRELASGQEKAELVIDVKNHLGSKRLAGSSKGESGLTNLIIAETLSQVGQVSKRIGYRWYDEVVPHQDMTVCKSIYSHLRQTAHALGILIFMVDHNPVATDYADHILVVEKGREKGSVCGTVRWR